MTLYKYTILWYTKSTLIYKNKLHLTNKYTQLYHIFYGTYFNNWKGTNKYTQLYLNNFNT